MYEGMHEAFQIKLSLTVPNLQDYPDIIHSLYFSLSLSSLPLLGFWYLCSVYLSKCVALLTGLWENTHTKAHEPLKAAIF